VAAGHADASALRHLGRVAEFPPEITEGVGVIWTPTLVDNYVLSAGDEVRHDLIAIR